jgi:hypothetical protein
MTRREMLTRAGGGFGLLALADLLHRDSRLEASPEDGLGLRPTGKARSVIFLFMGGGPSQVDTFDPKPEIARWGGQDVPASIAQGVPRIARAPLANLFPSPYRFRRCGQSGVAVSELFPEVGQRIDDVCVLRSCRHDSPIHAPAEYLATTGTQIGDRPSLGAWVTYGLGSENENLPGFIVMKAGETGRPVAWSSGFLPARFQATPVDPTGIPNVALPAGVTARQRREQLDLIDALNRHRLEQHTDSELEARIRSYELAFRMQAAA